MTHLTKPSGDGTMKEEARAAGPSRQKYRRPKGATARIDQDLQSLILKFHTSFRDCQELIAQGEMSTAEAFGFLADVCQLEYDKRFGHG